jgi:hypothetical protein
MQSQCLSASSLLADLCNSAWHRQWQRPSK